MHLSFSISQNIPEKVAKMHNINYPISLDVFMWNSWKLWHMAIYLPENTLSQVLTLETVLLDFLRRGISLYYTLYNKEKVKNCWKKIKNLFLKTYKKNVKILKAQDGNWFLHQVLLVLSAGI